MLGYTSNLQGETLITKTPNYKTMKIEILKTDITDTIKSLAKITTNKGFAMLENVKISAGQDGATLTACNLEIQCEIKIPAKLYFTGECTINAKTFLAIIKELKSQTIIIECVTEYNATIYAGKSQRTIETLPVVDFPIMHFEKELHSYNVREIILKEMLLLANCAKCKDHSRLALNGLLFSAGDNFSTVGCDGNRLAIVERDFENATQGKSESIIPNDSISFILHMLKDSFSNVQIMPSENFVRFTWDGITILVRKFAGQYPNYRQVIPKTSEVKLQLNRLEFLNIIKRILPNCKIDKDKDSPKTIKIILTENKLTISKASQDGHTIEEFLPINYQTTKEITIGFNPLFLSETLEALENESVQFDLTDAMSAGMLSVDGFQFIAMPTRFR